MNICSSISCSSYQIDQIRCDWFSQPVVKDHYHSHADFYEFVFVFEGNAVDEWPEQKQKLSSGMFYVYTPGSSHIYTHFDNFHYIQILLAADLLYLPTPLMLSAIPGYSRLVPEKGKRSETFLLNEYGMAKILELAAEIRKVYLARNDGWREEAFSIFLRLLFFLVKHLVPVGEERAGVLHRKISRAIRNMEEHITENSHNGELARMLNMSESSFLHHFKNLTGFSPAQYRIRLQLKRALVLLLTSSQISTIASESGFSDIAYFYRQFKRHFGIMPLEMHRKLIQQPQILDELTIALMKKKTDS